MMRIALVTPGGFDPGGRERVIPALLWLVERLARRHDVCVFVLRADGKAAAYELFGARVEDLVDVRGPWRKWSALGAAVRRAGPFDVIHGYWATPAGLAAAVVGRWLGVPSVVTLDSGELVSLPDIDYGLQCTWRGRQIVRLACALATRVTVCSGYMCALARARGIDPQIIPLGVDRRAFARAGRRPDGPPWRLLQVANLNRVKDQATLLDATRRVRAAGLDVRVDLVGQDTLGGAVQRLASSLGLGPAVECHGFQPSDRLPAFYGQAHLYVQSSRHEAAGVAVLEAAMSGVPVVGTRVGHVADFAPERAAAVAPQDPEAMAEILAALLVDPLRRVRLAESAHTWATSHDADWTAEEVERLYAHCRSRSSRQRMD